MTGMSILTPPIVIVHDGRTSIGSFFGCFLNIIAITMIFNNYGGIRKMNRQYYGSKTNSKGGEGGGSFEKQKKNTKNQTDTRHESASEMPNNTTKRDKE